MLSKLKQIWKIFFPDPPSKGFETLPNSFQYDKLSSALSSINGITVNSYTSHKINTNLCLNMKLHSATNGMILEVMTTDYTQMNPNTSKLHVLTHENLGKELQEIILLELLKK